MEDSFYYLIELVYIMYFIKYDGNFLFIEIKCTLPQSIEWISASEVNTLFVTENCIVETVTADLSVKINSENHSVKN